MIKRLICYLMPAMMFILTWEFLVYNNSQRQFLFASPLLIANVAIDELSNFIIWHDVGITLSEAGLGLVVGALLGTIVGLVLWTNESIAQ